MGATRRKSRTPRAPSRGRGAVTRDAVLQATTLVIAQKGVDAFTLRDVMHKAGVGVGSFYHFFPTRDALLVAWEEHATAKAVAVAVGRLQEQLSARRPVRAVVHAVVPVVFELLRTLVNAYGPIGKDAVLVRVSARQALAAQLEALVEGALAGAARADVRALPERVAARIVVRGVSYLAFDAVLADQDRLPGYAHEIAELVVRYLATAHDAPCESGRGGAPPESGRGGAPPESGRG